MECQGKQLNCPLFETATSARAKEDWGWGRRHYTVLDYRASCPEWRGVPQGKPLLVCTGEGEPEGTAPKTVGQASPGVLRGAAASPVASFLGGLLAPPGRRRGGGGGRTGPGLAGQEGERLRLGAGSPPAPLDHWLPRVRMKAGRREESRRFPAVTSLLCSSGLAAASGECAPAAAASSSPSAGPVWLCGDEASSRRDIWVSLEPSPFGSCLVLPPQEARSLFQAEIGVVGGCRSGCSAPLPDRSPAVLEGSCLRLRSGWIGGISFRETQGLCL